jgi:CO/xanthine dehydrogenase Mo-binding subunit
MSLAANPRLEQWVRIEPDGTATIFTGKVELGQGIVTALAQIAADELALPLPQVRMAPTRTDMSPNEGFTAGSQSIEVGGRAVRLAAAHALALLRAAAARHLGCPDPRPTGDGALASPDGARRVSYAQLAADVDWAAPVPDAPDPRAPAARRLTGTPVPRIDLLDTITGAAFVHDLRLPGMLHARVLRPPRRDAELLDLDRDAVAAGAGVVAVVVDGRFVAVLAEREEQALLAVERAQSAARWSTPDVVPAPGDVRAVLRGAPTRLHFEHHEGGTADAATDVTLRASYSRPFLAHASLGPSCAVAQMTGGALTVWTHSQGVFALRAQLAQALGLELGAVTVVHVRGAGCYGHNGADDAALDAALLTRAAGGRPVRVLWSRADELAWSPAGSAMVVDVAARVRDGAIAGWELDVRSGTHAARPGVGSGVNLLATGHLADPIAASAPFEPPPALGGGGDRNAVALYRFGAQHVHYHFAPQLPLRTSSLRTLGAFANVFAIESFMDELAALCGRDPVDWRLAHLDDERARTVVRRAADTARAAGAPDGEGTGLGIGFARYKNHAAYCAVCAEVEATDRLRVRRVFCAVDAGRVINPDGLANQIEGGIVQAISWTTKEQLGFRGDEVTTRDWETYPILRFSEVPDIAMEVVARDDLEPLGVGEAAAGPTAAAIANAVADAIGFRMRDLPISYAAVARAIEDAAPA